MTTTTMTTTTTLDPASIARLALDRGATPTQATTATAIALAESSGNPGALGDTTITDATWGPSVGLWQVRSLVAANGTGTARDASQLASPAFNASAAQQISGGWTNFTPWSTYGSGAYRGYLSAASAAVGKALGMPANSAVLLSSTGAPISGGLTAGGTPLIGPTIPILSTPIGSLSIPGTATVGLAKLGIGTMLAVLALVFLVIGSKAVLGRQKVTTAASQLPGQALGAVKSAGKVAGMAAAA